MNEKQATMETGKTVLTKDIENKKLKVTRYFNAAPEKVWSAWTDSNILDQWWAPKPWKAQTKKMNFTEGGYWLYCMVGPAGEKHWSRCDFKKIVPKQKFESEDFFCDEHGNKLAVVPGLPEVPGVSNWVVTFSNSGNGTLVEVDITFSGLADLEKMIEMGFEGGFAMGHGNLDELIAKNII